LRRIVVTGEAFPVELKRQFLSLLPHVRLVSFFAMTEAGAVTSLSHEEQFERPASIGRPAPGIEVRLVDDAGAEVSTGEAGELLVRAGEPGGTRSCAAISIGPKTPQAPSRMAGCAPETSPALTRTGISISSIARRTWC
jgi:acyl-coenzyme A synthetase/AMP-(fatty) acid ligase